MKGNKTIMRTLGTVALFAFLSVESISFAVAQNAAAQAATPDSILADLETQIKDGKKPLNDLNALYTKTLKDLETEAQKSGDLKLLIAVRNELKNFTGDGTKPNGEFPPLKRLQDIYSKERPKAAAKAEEQKKAAVASARRQLAEIRTSLTKANKIEEALKIQELIESLGKQGAVSKPAKVIPTPIPNIPSPLLIAAEPGELISIAYAGGEEAPGFSELRNRSGIIDVDACASKWLALKSDGSVLLPADSPDDWEKTARRARGVVDIASGVWGQAALDEKGKLHWWGDPKWAGNWPLGNLSSPVVNVEGCAAAIGALSSDGTVAIFGYRNDYAPQWKEVEKHFNEVFQLHAGSKRLWLWKKDGSIWNVGPTVEQRPPPFQVEIEGPFREIAISQSLFVALTPEGQILSAPLGRGGQTNSAVTLENTAKLAHPPPSETFVQIRPMKHGGSAAAAQKPDGSWVLFGDSPEIPALNKRLDEIGPLKDLALGNTGTPLSKIWLLGIK